MDGMNDVLALQSLSSDTEEAGMEATADNAISHASALLCGGGTSHVSLTVCD